MTDRGVPDDTEVRGECQVCGGESEHHPNCEIGVLTREAAAGTRMDDASRTRPTDGPPRALAAASPVPEGVAPLGFGKLSTEYERGYADRAAAPVSDAKERERPDQKYCADCGKSYKFHPHIGHEFVLNAPVSDAMVLAALNAHEREEHPTASLKGWHPERIARMREALAAARAVSGEDTGDE